MKVRLKDFPKIVGEAALYEGQIKPLKEFLKGVDYSDRGYLEIYNETEDLYVFPNTWLFKNKAGKIFEFDNKEFQKLFEVIE